jgi:hypothetical protein
MIEQLILAVAVGVFVGLICIGIGRLLKSVAVPLLVALGGFLEQYAWAFGLLAAVFYFFTGGPIFGFGGKHK